MSGNVFLNTNNIQNIQFISTHYIGFVLVDAPYVDVLRHGMVYNFSMNYLTIFCSDVMIIIYI